VVIAVSSDKSFYRQVLKLGANEASAQGLQNALSNECHAKFLTESRAFEYRDLAPTKGY
jgi:hypothetical protein